MRGTAVAALANLATWSLGDAPFRAGPLFGNDRSGRQRRSGRCRDRSWSRGVQERPERLKAVQKNQASAPQKFLNLLTCNASHGITADTPKLRPRQTPGPAPGGGRLDRRHNSGGYLICVGLVQRKVRRPRINRTWQWTVGPTRRC